jgi:hypothetical protein
MRFNSTALAATATKVVSAEDGCQWPIAFRGLIAAAQIATVILTWKLWSVREYPPLLPLLPVPQIDMGGPMIAALAVSFFYPRIGLPLQAAFLLWGIASDQSRIQPQMLSMLYMSCGTLPGARGGLIVARASLISLWFFSGFHKLTSPDFFAHGMPWLLSSLGLPADGIPPLLFGLGIGGAELALGVSSLIAPLRKAVALAAFLIHATIFAVLSPLGINWNPEVLPWNVVLAFAGLALIWPWRDRAPGVTWRNSTLAAKTAGILLLASPAGYWLGLVDAYLAHCLYSENTPRAFVCDGLNRCSIHLICNDAGVQVPPAHRLFGPLFLGIGHAGQWLEIEDPRRIARWRGLAPRKVLWSDLLPEDTEIVVPGMESASDPVVPDQE